MIDSFYDHFKVFIASPGDVKQERKMAEQVIQNVHNSCRLPLGLYVDCLNWEHMAPMTPSDGLIQNVIIEDLVKKCNVFVLILNKRWGSVEPGYTESNTEREIYTAIEMLQSKRKIMFLSYFRKLSTNPDPGIQEQKVRDLRKRLEDQQIWYQEYEHPEEFKDRLTNDLYQTILKFRVSTNKRQALTHFWQLGIPEGRRRPSIAIIYPPVDRMYMWHEQPDKMWHTRLVPHVVFEDIRAVQKIEKTLRIVGAGDTTANTVPCIPPNIQDYNRVWVCVGRNRPALKQLRMYPEAKFRFDPPAARRKARFLWKTSDSGDEYVHIRSPLDKYLVEQREFPPVGEWKSEYGRIVAKDFAILSRFSEQRQERPMVLGTLKDYFVAGIRGLGTWGAGWFIDRRYLAFREYTKEDDVVQILLEVTYCNERILEVKDVSNKPTEYFTNEYNLRTIRKHIQDIRADCGL